MATNQAERPEAEISDKVIKAALEAELIISKTNGERNKEIDLKGEAYTNGSIGNVTDGDLSFAGKHDWHGRVTSPNYPQLIHLSGRFPSGYESFGHAGPLPGGSKGGFVYKDIANAGQWVVAFDTHHLKAYIETGAVGPVNWKAVEQKLNASGSRSEAGASYCFHALGSVFIIVLRPI